MSDNTTGTTGVQSTTPQKTVTCIKGCGFFGYDFICCDLHENPYIFCRSAASEFMCSKCYKAEIEARKARGEYVEPTPAPAVGAAAAASPSKPKQEDTTRCWRCHVSIGLTGVRCQCGYTFCAKHRHAEKHKCDFDYKQQGKKDLEESNPQLRDKHHFTRIDSMENL